MGVFGYLDAGSGSMIVGAVAAKVGWRRMTGAFRKGDGLETPDPDPATDSPDSEPAANES